MPSFRAGAVAHTPRVGVDWGDAKRRRGMGAGERVRALADGPRCLGHLPCTHKGPAAGVHEGMAKRRSRRLAGAERRRLRLLR